jgi:hypothetical protein
MASIDKEIEEFFSRLIGNEDEQEQLVHAVQNGRATQWATDEGIGTCGYSDLTRGCCATRARCPPVKAARSSRRSRTARKR